MGGKAHADNKQIVEEQKRQAKDAALKEAQRQQRIKVGLKRIGYAFEGQPVMKTATGTFDWKGFDPKKPTVGLPAGYSAVQVDDPNYKAATATGTDAIGGVGETDNWGVGGLDRFGNQTIKPPAGQTLGSGTRATRGGNFTYDPASDHRGVQLAGSAGGGGTAAGTAPKVWAIKGPDGKLHYQTDGSFNWKTSTDTGKRKGGFDDKFYNEYGQAITDYYDPQVASQYDDAQRELTYRLARAGTLQSSAANTEVADLAQQNAVNMGAIANKADTAVGDLKAKVASEKQKAISQLYATENPDVAANQATAAVRDISLQQPDLSPLAQLFNIAAVGGANILRGYNNQQMIGNFESGLPPSAGSGRIIPA